KVVRCYRADFGPLRTIAAVMQDVFEGTTPHEVLWAELKTLRLLRRVTHDAFQNEVLIVKDNYRKAKGWSYDEFDQKLLEAKNARSVGLSKEQPEPPEGA